MKQWRLESENRGHGMGIEETKTGNPILWTGNDEDIKFANDEIKHLILTAPETKQERDLLLAALKAMVQNFRHIYYKLTPEQLSCYQASHDLIKMIKKT